MKLTKIAILQYLVIPVIVFILAIVLVKFICVPGIIRGISMEPTYKEGQSNYCWRFAFSFSKPKRFDIVVARFPEIEKKFLKRIVALENETVEFRYGKLFVNGKEIQENYVKYPCDWNIKPIKVAKGKVFIVGDNRSMSMKEHTFGETNVQSILGTPVF